MTDEQKQKIMKAIGLKANEVGKNPMDPFVVMEVVCDHLDLLHDQAALDAYLETQELANLEETETQLEEALAKVKADIGKKKTTPK